jgi:hypothetical protein
MKGELLQLEEQPATLHLLFSFQTRSRPYSNWPGSRTLSRRMGVLANRRKTEIHPPSIEYTYGE